MSTARRLLAPGLGVATAAGAMLVLAACAGSSTVGATIDHSTAPTTGSATVAADLLPLGDGKVSTTAPRAGYVWSCQPPNPNAPGAQAAGPWISGSTWDPARKIHVQGDVAWPSARYSARIDGGHRDIRTNRVPVHEGTGVFPIDASDPAASYDMNPNSIVPASVRVSLPVTPRPAAKPSCLGFGGIGILDDGVLLFDALDGQGRDAVAHEVLDRCDGHPAPGGVYHHHDVPSCLLQSATGPATLVGYAFDGYGIFVERDSSGQLLTNADLDACHGRTSVVPWNGKPRRIYHYDATAAYPYTLGCFHGTPTIRNSGPPAPPP